MQLRRFTKAFGPSALGLVKSLGLNPQDNYNPMACEVCGNGLAFPEGYQVAKEVMASLPGGEVLVAQRLVLPLGRGWRTEAVMLRHDNPLCRGEAVWLHPVGRENVSPCTCQW